MRKKIKIITILLTTPSLLMTNEWNAQLYHQNSQVQFKLGSDVINQCTFSGNEDILDVGCGNGALTHEMAKKTLGNVIGTDVSVNMITLAQGEYSLPNLSFSVCSATDLDFDQQFNLVFSMSCLHWVKDKQKAFSAIYKALKPGGKFIFRISTTPPDRDYPLIEISNNMKVSPKWQPLFINHSWPFYLEKAETFIPMLNTCGFEIKHFESAYQGVEFKDPEDILQHLRGLTWLNNLSDEKKEEFLQELVQKYTENKTSPYSYPVYQVCGVVEKPLQ